MGKYLGVDVGTTSITGLILDTETRQVLHTESASNTSEVTSHEDRARGRSEWDIDAMVGLAFDLLRALADKSAKAPISGIGVTGQMHGMVPVDKSKKSCSPFIGWQDQRCQGILPDGRTYIERMAELGGDGFLKSGCQPATGYMGSTLFWLAHNNLLPKGALACFAPDYLVGRLCNLLPVTDPTNAASSGVYDVFDGRWNAQLIEVLGLRLEQLPKVWSACQCAGVLSDEAASATGLPAGLAVAVACGDNQASFAGAVAEYGEDLLVNMGTGGQVSLFAEAPTWPSGLDLRPFLQKGFLLVGAGLCGGRSYRALKEFVCRIGEHVFGLSPCEMPGIYDRLNELAASVPKGADGLCCEPTFAGSRTEPMRRAAWWGMSEANFTPGHLARALLEGMAEQFHLFYKNMLAAGVRPRCRLVGSGNGIRNNPLLSKVLSQVFDMPMQVARHTEEAAVGAALCAAVAVGEFATIQEAGRHFLLGFPISDCRLSIAPRPRADVPPTG